MALDGAAKSNIFLTRGAGRAAEFKGAKDSAILGNAAKLVGASGEIKADKWRRPERANISNPFLQSGQKEGVFSSLKNFHIEDETESKQREFSAESWLDD